MRQAIAQGARQQVPTPDPGALRGDLGPLQYDQAADTDAPAMKICRLLRRPPQSEELGPGGVVEDEDADPVGPAP